MDLHPYCAVRQVPKPHTCCLKGTWEGKVGREGIHMLHRAETCFHPPLALQSHHLLPGGERIGNSSCHILRLADTSVPGMVGYDSTSPSPFPSPWCSSAYPPPPKTLSPGWAVLQPGCTSLRCTHCCHQTLTENLGPGWPNVPLGALSV